ncbi:UDP-N-acetylglucosamine--N-acetylmuramyl-(pentapeptide) pyrophosphoryl-undecaprenol N-acetylglucosamine transferase [Patescibacteria group bacterium]|nr:UDP-N-acetylglucosamine--N-acetylmuramyl-(pentapeptide) pyrophosphoryl-undecaprenol N-acetylglucosamine transferase [Patescibacteria group bacterium]
MKKIRILFVGGGSGGHIYPLIAVVQKIQHFIQDIDNRKLDLRYFGNSKAYKKSLESNGIKCSYVVLSKFRRYFSFKNIVDFFKFFIALFQSLWLVFWFMPNVVFSKGGPGSLAIIFVCKFFAIPIVVHESDSVPGLTNLISGKMAKKIFLSFDGSKKYFLNKNIEVVGNPIRSNLMIDETGEAVEISDLQKKEAKKKFGFDTERPLLLVIGGSQGATVINNFVLKNIEALSEKFQILHQIGSDNFENFKKEYTYLSKALPDSVKNNYKPYSYFDENLKDAYVASDLALARAGSGTIFELAYFGKPAILIPLPDSANDHQDINAYAFEDAGAGIDIQQENFLSHLVLLELESFSKPENLKRMSKSASAFYKSFSAETIATYLLSFGGINVQSDKISPKEALLR